MRRGLNTGMDIISLAVSALIGALGFWLRGSSLFATLMGRGATTARLLAWAIPMGLVAWLLTPLGWPWAVGVGVAMYLGCLLPWWGSLDMGNSEGTFIKDFLMHTLRGIIWVAPTIAVMIYPVGMFAGLPLLGAGMLCGVAYEIGWMVWKERATEVGEVLFGGLIGAGLYLSATNWVMQFPSLF